MSTFRNGMGALLVAALTLAAMLASPQLFAQKLYTTKLDKWINWNIKFKPGTDSMQRKSVIDDVISQIAAFSKTPIVDVPRKKGKITGSLRKQSGKENKNNFYIVRMVAQPCNNGDELFWNIVADAEIRALDSVPTQSGSPAPKPIVTPKGGMTEFLSYNNKLNLSPSLVKVKGSTSLLSFALPVHINNNAVVAVLDSGIDTTLFAEGIRSEILWNGPTGSKNMVSGEDVNNYMDDYPKRHGTAVASIILNSFYQASHNTALPKLMVIRVLDSKGEGSVFDLCCGINYAANNHATVINASLGYTLEGTDPIKDESLEYCLAKCQADSIPLVAAAGNTEEPREEGKMCETNTSGSNRITSTSLFLPAYYASEPDKYTVISVTGLRKPGIACYYQYFSEKFVTLGVLNENTETNCCSYKLPFFFDAVEGTSYSTPVVSGRLAEKISGVGHPNSIEEYMREMNAQVAPSNPGSIRATQKNQYIMY